MDVLEIFEKSKQFDVFLVFQKVFSRMPGGCRHQETSGNRILDKFYRCFCDLKVENVLLKRKNITKQGYRNRIKPRVWGIKDTCLSKVVPALGPPRPLTTRFYKGLI